MSDDYYCGFVLSGKTVVDVVAETDQVLAFIMCFEVGRSTSSLFPRNTCVA